MKTTHVLLAFAVVLISLTGQAFVKAGLNHVKANVANPTFTTIVMHAVVNPKFIAGFVMLGTSALLYIALLYGADFTRALPVMGAIGYLIIPVYGYYFLGEALTVYRILGILLLLAGMFFLKH